MCPDETIQSRPTRKLRPLELPDIPWTEVTADSTTDLPLSNDLTQS
jgi:hypothetical protein